MQMVHKVLHNNSQAPGVYLHVGGIVPYKGMADKVMTIESWTDGGDNIVRLLPPRTRS